MKIWLLSLLLVSLGSVAAEPTTASAKAASVKAAPVPIAIEADRMELNQKTGTNHYRGNVVLTRGGMQIKASSILLYTSGKKLQRAVAEGKPVYLEQQGTNSSETMRAQSEHMEYLPLSESIELKGNALLWREGNKFTGDKITYDLKKQTVKASGDKAEGGRVRVLLQPEGEAQTTEEKP